MAASNRSTILPWINKNVAIHSNIRTATIASNYASARVARATTANLVISYEDWTGRCAGRLPHIDLIFSTCQVAWRCPIAHIASNQITAPVDIIKLYELATRERPANTGCIVMIEDEVICTCDSIERTCYIIKRVVLDFDVMRISVDNDAKASFARTAWADLVVVNMYIGHSGSLNTWAIWVRDAKTRNRLARGEGNRPRGSKRSDCRPDSRCCCSSCRCRACSWA